MKKIFVSLWYFCQSESIHTSHHLYKCYGPMRKHYAYRREMLLWELKIEEDQLAFKKKKKVLHYILCLLPEKLLRFLNIILILFLLVVLVHAPNRANLKKMYAKCRISEAINIFSTANKFAILRLVTWLRELNGKNILKLYSLKRPKKRKII